MTLYTPQNNLRLLCALVQMLISVHLIVQVSRSHTPCRMLNKWSAYRSLSQRPLPTQQIPEKNIYITANDINKMQQLWLIY